MYIISVNRHETLSCFDTKELILAVESGNKLLIQGNY